MRAIFSLLAAVRAVFDFVPNRLPFLAPNKRALAGGANFTGKVFFF
jgi:hypothetical protein